MSFKQKLILIIITLIMALFSLSSLANAAVKKTVVFEDDFSNGFEKWEVVRDDWHYWRIVDGQAEAFVELKGHVTELFPKDEFWDDSWTNYEFELDFEPIEGIDRNLVWGYQAYDHWYEIHFVDDFFNLVRRVGGILNPNLFKNYILENGKKYHMKIVFNQGRIQIFVDGQEIIDYTDVLYETEPGKIALKAGTGLEAPTLVRFDNIVVHLIEEQANDGRLGVTYWQQFDARWADLEFNHAPDWTTSTTFESWGCAVSSMAMILDFYGLNKFPDGKELNPKTLDDWLTSEEDGYINGGLINWWAVMRLAKAISEKYSTETNKLPKLEYRRVAAEQAKETAISEIQAGRPVILQIKGHFLVADGVSEDGQDLLIRDPAFTYQTFSEHQKDLLSTRVFIPSYTDLSGFFVVYDPGLIVEISDEEGNSVAGLQNYEDGIRAFQADAEENDAVASTPARIFQTLAKAKTGKYLITVSRSSPPAAKSPNFGFSSRVGGPVIQPAKELFFEIYAYDEDANPSIFKFLLDDGAGPWQFVLDYQKQGVSSLEELETQ
ncbi:MAG: C39 family peptidase [Candidatus Woesebacteria bacterium]|jgi:hypothetical protein